MRALTINQPWAWAILRAGKTVENRTWATAYRGPLLIHAGASRKWYAEWTPAEWRAAFGRTVPALPAWANLDKSAVLGVADLVDCVPADRRKHDPWADGPFCFVLANVRPLRAVPARGALGLWTPGPDLAAAVRAQLAAGDPLQKHAGIDVAVVG